MFMSYEHLCFDPLERVIWEFYLSAGRVLFENISGISQSCVNNAFKNQSNKFLFKNEYMDLSMGYLKFNKRNSISIFADGKLSVATWEVVPEENATPPPGETDPAFQLHVVLIVTGAMRLSAPVGVIETPSGGGPDPFVFHTSVRARGPPVPHIWINQIIY